MMYVCVCEHVGVWPVGTRKSESSKNIPWLDEDDAPR